MYTRDDIFAYVKQKFRTEPDYPWLQAPEHAVLRHKDGKWFGLVMSIPRNRLGLKGNGPVDVLNLKCDPMLNRLLRDRPGYFPAYHMNKEHWISVVLDGGADAEELRGLIDASYQLTRTGKAKARRKTSPVK